MNNRVIAIVGLAFRLLLHGPALYEGIRQLTAENRELLKGTRRQFLTGDLSQAEVADLITHVAGQLDDILVYVSAIVGQDVIAN